jgi:uncharacterized membrane protein
MDTALLVTGLASAAFVASHLGLSAAPLRDRLVARLGETGFQIVHGLVAVLTLGTLIAAYSQASHSVSLWCRGQVCAICRCW